MTLFDDRGYPYKTATSTRWDHPDTSHAAARRIYPRTGTLRWKVLRILADRWPGGLTDEEMQEDLGMNPNTQRPRRVELVKDGWVRDSGQRRPTRGGDPAIVWIFIPETVTR